MSRLFCIAALSLVAAPAAALEDLLPPQIVHEPCEFYQKGTPFRVIALFYDDSPIFDPKVMFRSGRKAQWRNAPFAKSPTGQEFIATIKARDLKGPLDYFIEAFDENGNGPARYGSPEAPVRIQPSERAPACNQLGEKPAIPLTTAGSERPPEPVAGPAPTPAPATEKTAETEQPDKAGKKQKGAAEAEAEPPAAAASAAPAEAPPPATAVIEAQPAEPGTEVAAVSAEAPPPAKRGCGAEEPPSYCSPVLWSLVGVGVALAAGGGIFLGWCFAGGPCAGPGQSALPERVDIDITGGSLDTAFGLEAR